MKSNFTSTRNSQNLVFFPSIEFIDVFHCIYLFIFGAPMELSTCQSLNGNTKGKRKLHYDGERPFSPSEVNIVSLYQRNVPLQKNNLKFRKYELCSLYSLSLRRSIVYALPLPPASPLVPPHPSSPPAGGCSSSCPSVDERLWLSCKSVGRLQKGQPCKCLLTPADISEEES